MLTKISDDGVKCQEEDHIEIKIKKATKFILIISVKFV